VRFDRRAPLIAACMRLHNFCIDKGVEDELRAQNGMTEVVPGRWATTPKYDRDGRPVEYLDIERERGIRRRSARVDVSGRDELVRAIADAGLRRPTLPDGVHRKKGKKRKR
jgi:hypothetical protein